MERLTIIIKKKNITKDFMMLKKIELNQKKKVKKLMN